VFRHFSSFRRAFEPNPSPDRTLQGSRNKTRIGPEIHRSEVADGSRMTRYAAIVFPWIIFALVAVPLVVVAFVATRRRTAAGEHPASEDAQARALTEQEFAEAEAYEAKWREEDKERFHEERLP
jgi:hypothetical protein